MTTIPLQPPTPPPLPANVPRGLPVVTVTNPPADLAKLAVGTAIEGTVTTDAGKTAVQVQTVLGTVQIQTTLPLDKGARLTLVLQNLTEPMQLQIAAIDGRRPLMVPRGAGPTPATNPAAGTPQAAAGPGLVAPGAAGVSSPLAALRGLVGLSLTATLLRPAVPSAPLFYGPGQTATPGTPAPAGASVPAGFANPGPHAAAGPPGPAAGLATPLSATAPIPGTASPLAAGPLATGPLPLNPGTQMLVRIVAVNPTPADPTAVPGANPAVAATPAQTATLSVGQTMTAVVTGTTPAGHPVLLTPAGTVTLPTPAPLPRGAEVVLEVRSEPLLAEPVSGPPLPLRPFALVQARTWPALAEAYQALQTADPGAAQQMAAAILPQANSRLTTHMLFFLSALRGGDVGGWLTEDSVRLLRRDRPDLLGRLGDEFRQIATLAREPVAGDWRIALIPFFTGSDIEQVRLYLRPHGGEEDEADGTSAGTRFIIDVNLSRLGRLQLDGLVREGHKRVDLIVRSDQPLPPVMQADIRTLFEEANALTGVTGGLTFQAAPANFVDLAPTALADGPGLLA